MSVSVLNSFVVADNFFTQVIDTSNDSVYIKDEDENIIFEIDNTAKMTDGGSVKYGKFRLDENRLWVFKDAKDEISVQTGNKDLIKAEMKIVKLILLAQLS